MRRRQTRESERGERQVEKERDREISERDREHALALWSIRPCKPKAQRTVGGLHQHPGPDQTHTWIRDTLLRGQPGEHEQSRNSMVQLYF